VSDDPLAVYIEDLIELAAKGNAAPAEWIAADIRALLKGNLPYQPLVHCDICGEIVDMDDVDDDYWNEETGCHRRCEK